MASRPQRFQLALQLCFFGPDTCHTLPLPSPPPWRRVCYGGQKTKLNICEALAAAAKLQPRGHLFFYSFIWMSTSSSAASVCVCVPVCVAGLCRLMLPGGIAICNKSKSAAAAATARRLQQLQVDTQTRLRLLPLPLPLPLPAQARIPTMLFPPPPLTRGPGRQQHTLSTQACVRFQVESLSATVSKH